MVFIPKSYSDLYAVNTKHDYHAEYQAGTCMFTFRRVVSWDDCPHLQREDKLIERQNILKKYGKNSAFVQSMLYGRFQRSDEFNLIYTDDDLKMMRQAMLGGGRKPVGSDVKAAGDISGGGDEQIMMLRIGTDVVMQDYRQCENELDQADYWVQTLRTLGIQPWQFAVDGGGLGATVANYMELRLGFNGIQRCQANVGPTYKFEFRDKYTEVHFLLKELLSAGVLRLKKFDEELLKQMRSRRFVEMEAGEKIKTEPKPLHRKREKSSPDRLDTLVYLFYDFDRSLISVFENQGLEIEIDETAPTKMEKEAEAAAMKGTGRAFSKMRNLSNIRSKFVNKTCLTSCGE